jgi:hypothetical protein
MNLVLRLLMGIFAIVALSLGIPFAILGFSVDDAFLITGLACLAAGVVFGGSFLVLHRRERAARDRRRNGTRAKAPVIAAKFIPWTRVGAMLTYDLTVRVPAPRGVTEATRRVLLPPNQVIKAGDEIEIYFDPNDPENFEPALAT